MRITRFSDEYESVAPLLGLAPRSFRDRDEGSAPTGRWVAWADGRAVAVVTARRRADDRMFLSFHGDVIPTGAMLTRAASDAIGTKLYTNADEAFHDLFLAAGFADEMQSEAFELDFAAARAAVERAWIPSWCRIISAAEADRERLLTLDSQLRQDVPGCDGWCGDRNALDADLDEAPPFDPDGYLVASDNRSGEYVGLIRIWRNPSRPRIGMIGVLRSHRGTVLAAALLKRALAAAATWGSPTFTTEAALSNPVTYPRLIALGARRQGRFWQMVYG